MNVKLVIDNGTETTSTGIVAIIILKAANGTVNLAFPFVARLGLLAALIHATVYEIYLLR